MTRSRNFIFTIQNRDEFINQQLARVSQSLAKHNYICYGYEIAPDTGNLHIQGYVQLSQPMTFSSLQKYFAIKKDGKLVKFHCDIARGDLASNQRYTKKEGEWFEYGEPKNQGSRSDLSELRERLKNDPKQLTQILSNEDLNLQQFTYVEKVVKYLFKHRTPDNPPKVFWVWGSSGVGKTKKVYDEFGVENVFSVDDYQWLGENYRQQQVFLMDDFRSTDIKFNKLLKILDRYPLSLPVKGSHVPLNSPYIIITSNTSIDEAFQSINFLEDLEQLKRRLYEVHFDQIKNVTFQDYTPGYFDNLSMF